MSARLDHGEDTLNEMHEINVTSFIDVMLVLLIIFMVAAPLATVDLPVDLPGSVAETPPQQDKPIYVTLRLDRSLALGEDPVSRTELAARLDAAAKGNKDTRIVLRGDKLVPYGEVMEITNVLLEAGYHKFTLEGLRQ
jgi:biopolymer transport protein ExbD